ncbi:hypothetical protein [Micromonospora sp. DT47]|uniref:hypothetical protein n=1 Tax=Micromonospora sp. DT47 TaxID=3393431 RepID=UPI003CECDC6E
MLPVALTSPLWWVTRWISRLLTGLAVAMALSLSGPALPDDVAPAAALPLGVSLPATAGPPAAPATASTALSFTTSVARSVPTIAAPADDSPLAGAGGLTDRHAGPTDAVGVADRAAATAGATTAPLPALAGLSPAASGPRAPPAA